MYVSLCQPWMKISISFPGISQPEEGRHTATVTRSGVINAPVDVCTTLNTFDIYKIIF